MEAFAIQSTPTPYRAVKFIRGCRNLAGAAAIAVSMALAGCYGPPSQRDALMGGAIGAGSGALIGSAVDHPGMGALVGGVAGAGAGYLDGEHQENEWRYRYGGY